MTSQEALAEIERLATKAGYHPSTLCRLAVGNSRLPKRLADGGTVTLSVMARLAAFSGVNKQKPRK